MTSSSASNVFSNTSTKIFRPEEFILRRVKLFRKFFLRRIFIFQQASDDELSSLKRRQYDERIRTLESLVFEKDSIIHDLQRKLDKATRVCYLFVILIHK